MKEFFKKLNNCVPKKMLRFWAVTEFHISRCFFLGDPDCCSILLTSLYFRKLVGSANEKDQTHIIRYPSNETRQYTALNQYNFKGPVKPASLQYEYDD